MVTVKWILVVHSDAAQVHQFQRLTCFQLAQHHRAHLVLAEHSVVVQRVSSQRLTTKEQTVQACVTMKKHCVHSTTAVSAHVKLLHTSVALAA